MAKKTLGVNPWATIWFQPRNTLRKIITFDPKYRFLVLSFLYGLPMLFHTAQNLSLGEKYPMVGIVIAAVVLATFLGMLGITIASALLLWTGKWIGGKGNYHEVRAAVSWSNVPNIIGIIVWVALLFVFREQAFMENFDQMTFNQNQQVFLQGSFLVMLIMAIWSFVILVKGLGEVQGFSAWKGILNVLIPFFLIGIVIWAISWIFWMAAGLIGV